MTPFHLGMYFDKIKDIRLAREALLPNLIKRYDERESSHLIYLLLEHFLGFNRNDWMLNRSINPNQEGFSKLITAYERLCRGEPIQYIIGSCRFYGRIFQIMQGALIPRPETEELVDWILKDYQQLGELKIWEIGTGSGCIPITLALELSNPHIISSDFSEDALKVAELNNETFEAGVQLVLDDVFQSTIEGEFDLMVSNPPYIPVIEKAEISDWVLEHEPASALFVPDEDPFKFYIKIAELAEKQLKKGGKLYLECHSKNAVELAKILKNNFSFKTIELRADINGRHRMLRADT